MNLLERFEAYLTNSGFPVERSRHLDCDDSLKLEAIVPTNAGTKLVRVFLYGDSREEQLEENKAFQTAVNKLKSETACVT